MEKRPYANTGPLQGESGRNGKHRCARSTKRAYVENSRNGQAGVNQKRDRTPTGTLTMAQQRLSLPRHAKTIPERDLFPSWWNVKSIFAITKVPRRSDWSSCKAEARCLRPYFLLLPPTICRYLLLYSLPFPHDMHEVPDGLCRLVWCKSEGSSRGAIIGDCLCVYCVPGWHWLKVDELGWWFSRFL
jgi:hypothetical protein